MVWIILWRGLPGFVCTKQANDTLQEIQQHLATNAKPSAPIESNSIPSGFQFFAPVWIILKMILGEGGGGVARGRGQINLYHNQLTYTTTEPLAGLESSWSISMWNHWENDLKINGKFVWRGPGQYPSGSLKKFPLKAMGNWSGELLVNFHMEQ